MALKFDEEYIEDCDNDDFADTSTSAENMGQHIVVNQNCTVFAWYDPRKSNKQDQVGVRKDYLVGGLNPSEKY